MINTIIDIYHRNGIDLETTLAGGIDAIIHKATEGADFQDSKYHERREAAKELGFLWGAYHSPTMLITLSEAAQHFRCARQARGHLGAHRNVALHAH
jgi:GH25 family lysozyme M1 (1,4-beta-N-acetylmuramidase)